MIYLLENSSNETCGVQIDELVQETRCSITNALDNAFVTLAHRNIHS